MLRTCILFMIYEIPTSAGKVYETGFSQKFVSRLERGQDKIWVTMCSTAPTAENIFSLNSTQQIYLGCTTVVTKYNGVLNLGLPDKFIMITVMLHKVKAQKYSYIYRNIYTCLQKHFSRKKLKATG